MASWPATDPEPLGAIDDLKKSLPGLFPDIRWDDIQGTWFGRYEDVERYAEFQISPEDDGRIRFLTVRRTERREIEALSRHLGVVAVDAQRMELYSNVTRRWSAAG